MPITTDSYYDIKQGETVLDRIGLSETLDNYTIEEIADYAFVGSYSYYGRQISEKSLPDYTYVGYSTLHGSCPFAATFNAPNYDQIFIDNGGTTHYNLTENGIYRAVVLIHMTNNTYPRQLVEDDFEYAQIITEMDAPKYSVNFGTTEDMEFADTSYMVPKDFTAKYNTHLGAIDNTEIATCGFEPYIVLELQEHYFIVNANTIWSGINDIPSFAATSINDSNYSVCANQLYDYTESYYAGISEAVNQWYQSNDFTNPIDVPFIRQINGAPVEYWCQYEGYASRIGFQYNASNGFSQYFCFTDEDKLKQYIAGICGLHFIVNGIVYKPIITDNFVIGYSDDLDVQSDLDNYVGSTNHVLPVDPPTPPAPHYPDEDNDDPIPVVAAPFASGLARYYITTAGSLVLMHISEALGAWDLKDSGKDLYKNIISCKLIKPPTAVPSASSVFSIYGVKPQYQGSDITIPEVTDNPSISFGSYSIPRKFNDFRDYAPYTKVEIYLPYCGWTVLPSHVVGRSVSVTYYTDIIAATCKAVVYCGANVVAEAAGVIGMDIPMVAENAGAKAEAVTAGLLAYGKAGLQTAIGVGAAVATKGKAGVQQAASGIGNLISSYSQTAMAFNTSFTEVNGKNGDGCCIAGISAIVIKITRPKFGSNTVTPYVPAEYGHTIGFTSMKTVTVGSVTGLLIAENVDTSGIAGATERERQLIKLYLESGIIVEHPS